MSRSSPITSDQLFSVRFQGAGRNIPDFCEVGLKISGVSPLAGTPALELPDVGVTGLTVTTTSSHTVAFLGTNSGNLIKVSLTPSDVL